MDRDLQKGKSRDFRTGENLAGLCAWKIDLDNPYASDEEIIEAAIETAKQISKNTYGGYSSNNTFAILEADYVGSANDGSLVRVNRVISIETL